jgi:hypothetical protein
VTEIGPTRDADQGDPGDRLWISAASGEGMALASPLARKLASCRFVVCGRDARKSVMLFLQNFFTKPAKNPGQYPA